MASSDPPPERALMTELAAGNVAALGTLFDRLGDALYALAARITGDQERASKVVEQVFAEVWERRGGRIAEDVAVPRLLARCRSLALAARDSRPGMAAGRAATGADPRGAADGAAGDSVAAALARLPERARTTLELAYFEGLSVVQIAERTRLDREHVLDGLRQALDELKRLPRPREWGMPS